MITVISFMIVITRYESELTGLPMKRVEDIKSYINHDVPKVMGVDYVGNITEARVDLNGFFNEDIDVTTSKPFFLEFMAKDVSMQSKHYVRKYLKKK